MEPWDIEFCPLKKPTQGSGGLNPAKDKGLVDPGDVAVDGIAIPDTSGQLYVGSPLFVTQNSVRWGTREKSTQRVYANDWSALSSEQKVACSNHIDEEGNNVPIPLADPDKHGGPSNKDKNQSTCWLARSCKAFPFSVIHQMQESTDEVWRIWDRPLHSLWEEKGGNGTSLKRLEVTLAVNLEADSSFQNQGSSMFAGVTLFESFDRFVIFGREGVDSGSLIAFTKEPEFALKKTVLSGTEVLTPKDAGKANQNENEASIPSGVEFESSPLGGVPWDATRWRRLMLIGKQATNGTIIELHTAYDISGWRQDGECGADEKWTHLQGQSIMTNMSLKKAHVGLVTFCDLGVADAGSTPQGTLVGRGMFTNLTIRLE